MKTMTTTARTFTALLLTASIAAGACGKSDAAGSSGGGFFANKESSGEKPAAAAPMEPPLVDGMAETRSVGGQAASAGLDRSRDARGGEEGRKIVRTGHLELKVEDYAPARRKIDELLKASGGFVASANVSHADGRVSEATLILRLPARGFEDAVAQLSGLGTVLVESIAAEDVTGEWVDLEARLANARKLEGRLVELAATQAGNVSQLLEVERELGRVRGEIEQMEGRHKVLADQVSLSTLTLRVVTRVPFVAAVKPSFGDDVQRTLGESWAGLNGLGKDIALGLVSLLPWTPLLAAAYLVLRRLRRKYLPAVAPQKA